MLYKFRHHGVNRHEVEMLANYPALRTAPREVLADLSTWADRFVVRAGEPIGGLDVAGRWSYLVADPTAVVLDGGQARAVGESIGLGRAMRSSPPPPLEIVAVDDIEVLAIAPTRLSALVDYLPHLQRLAINDACPTLTLVPDSGSTSSNDLLQERPAAA
jgi:hypothetical protein